MPARFPIQIRTLPLGLLGLAVALTANPALAQTPVSLGSGVVVEGTSAPSYMTDKFNVSFGTFIVGSKLDANLNGTATGSGNTVNLGRDFDMGNYRQRMRADAMWRITPKHHVRFVWFNNNMTRTRTFDKDIAWGDYTFLANGSISLKSSLNVFEGYYEYAFVRKPDLEVAAGAGIHTMYMSVKLSGNATVTDSSGNVQPASYSTSNSSLPAPLPVIVVRATWAVTPNIYIEPEAQWLKLHYDAYNGNWWDARLAAKWMFTRHFGVGLGYDYYKVNASVSRTNYNGNVSLGYSGVNAMLQASW